MGEKIIKTEQWTVKAMISRIENKEIQKPDFQRKKTWDIIPKNNNTPNEKSYIEFLLKTQNSVHAITFGLFINEHHHLYTNIDGNNRINALSHFMKNPFDLFEEYLLDLNSYIDSRTIHGTNTRELLEEQKILFPFEYDEGSILKQIFRKMSYNDFIKIKYNKYFYENGYADLYEKSFKTHRDEIETQINNIQERLQINGNTFENVLININIFSGYKIHELCEIFEDINRYHNTLTQQDLLTCRLKGITNFDINDNILKIQIKENIKKYFQNKSSGEVLECYSYSDTDKINALSFIMGFQYWSSENHSFIIIEEEGSKNGLTLYFKLYQLLYDSFENTFTTRNVNDFINNINLSCQILEKVKDIIFTDKINDKLFNATCKKKLETLSKNNIFVIFASIIGFLKKDVHENEIITNLEKSILFHFMVSDIKNKENKEHFKRFDILSTDKGGCKQLSNITKNLIANPQEINSKLAPDIFGKLINTLFNEVNNPKDLSFSRRRKYLFFEKTMMFYYYKQRLPINLLNYEFNIDHIVPFSSVWENKIEINRTGNLIPILDSMNKKRSNKHISLHSGNSEGSEFCNYIKELIPSNQEYDKFIEHNNNNKPKILSNELYNHLCNKNEEYYKKNFIGCLFPYPN